jgi:hypothetical protein
MAEPSRAEQPRAAGEPVASARVAELERRIRELEALDESAFGGFTHLDWLACALIALVLPAALLVWFAR